MSRCEGSDKGHKVCVSHSACRFVCYRTGDILVDEEVKAEIEARALELFAAQHILMNPHHWKQHIQHRIDKLRGKARGDT